MMYKVAFYFCRRVQMLILINHRHVDDVTKFGHFFNLILDYVSTTLLRGKVSLHTSASFLLYVLESLELHYQGIMTCKQNILATFKVFSLYNK